jgi:beta-galactosidase/beta-glucuronidase
VYEYDAWYDAADEYGVLIMHDMMFIEQGTVRVF